MTRKAFWIGLLLVSSTASIGREDWPEWRGKGRLPISRSPLQPAGCCGDKPLERVPPSA
jgi:hypothetical protein